MTVRQLTLDGVQAWEPQLPTDPDQWAVLAVLRVGHRRSRSELVNATGLADRTVRACVEELRRAGWPICSSSDQVGYVLSWRPEDLERLERDLTSRALSALRTRSAIRRARERRAA